MDTYAPVVKLASIRILLAIAAIYGLEIHQMDVVTAFLAGELKEEIYMEQPEGIRSRHKGGGSCLQASEEHLQPEASTTSLESTNSTLFQVNRLRPNVLGSLCVHQQEN